MDKRGALPGFLRDERIRFWVSQYKDLLKLESHLDQKYRETEVFEERLSHREALSPQYLPAVQRFSGEAGRSGLRVAVPEPTKDLEPFRRRIASARADLIGLRGRTIALREALLPPLRGILLRASEKWLNRIVRLVAEAELSQIQILDGQDGGMKP
ncbi:MAG: hypothetical protein ABGX83_04980 [Nitrospira sp.]|nr:hypothetical protein [Candidatus Manganitrophaceae bacterium]HIL34848.1 hypothetical protein [Candidatus Manganitrophaceae bacterium]